MKSFIVLVSFICAATISMFGQSYNYQAYVQSRNTEDSVRASFYIAGDQFDPTTVFNPSNYPVWFKENVSVRVQNGILNYQINGTDTDSIIHYRGGLYLYVTINGSPFDRVLISAVPYATHSIFSDTAFHSLRTDTSEVSLNAITSEQALNALTADTAEYAVTSGVAFVADSALTVTDGSITSSKLALNCIGVEHLNTVNAPWHMKTLAYINGDFVWTDQKYNTLNTTEKTLIVPTTIGDNTVYFISKVAQDYTLVEPTANEGRIIRVVNASTANTITVNWTLLFGGSIAIQPRSSMEFVFIDGEWIKL
jgi:hypothetical protein